MSITAYKVEAVGHDRTGKDFGYVNIMYRYGNKKSCPRPDQCEKLEVMWADESVYGPPAPGSKVGDFIQTWLMGSWNCGVFTHREIAQRLMDTFTGLKLKELAWFENPREKTLKNGKPRARRAKWLPDREVDLVYLYSDRDGCLGREHLVHVYPRSRREADRHELRQSGRQGDHHCGIGNHCYEKVVACTFSSLNNPDLCWCVLCIPIKRNSKCRLCSSTDVVCDCVHWRIQSIQK